MLTDDIEYLGSRNAPRSSLATALNHPFTHPQRSVTAVALHIEKSGGGDPAYAMMFRRVNTTVVSIGRRPGSESERRSRDNDTGRAMFRCAVVSRKHAKMVFSDLNVFLVDLNSHHGTHIRKLGETVSRALKPEVHTLLSDGDVITFGKSVGRNNEVVRPVVARVELLYGSNQDSSPSSFLRLKPLVVPTNDTSRPKPSSPSSPSGRYGVYVSSSSSSSDDGSSPISSHDSDIEEIPAPSSFNTESSQGISRQDNLGHAFEALKRLLPPIHDPSDSRKGPSPPTVFSPTFPLRSSPFNIRQFPSFSHASLRSSSIGYDDHDIPEWGPVGFDAYSNDIFEERSDDHRSRSTSPMDLASPSPVPSVVPLENVANSEPAGPVEPVVVGAWVGSRHSSPVSEQHPPSQIVVTSEDSAPIEIVASRSPEPTVNAESQCIIVNDSDSPDSGSGSTNTNRNDNRSNTDGIDELKSSLQSVRGELAKLQVHRKKYKSRFNANVHTIAEKLTDLDERVTDVNSSYTSLTDQMESVTNIDIPDLQNQVEALQEQLDAAPFDFPAAIDVDALLERDDVLASIESLDNLVIEMRELKENTEKQMAADLEAVKAARVNALAAIAEIAQTPVPMSLKRKRSDDENGVGDEGVEIASVDIGDSDRTKVPIATTIPSLALPATTTANIGGIDVPRPKRARKVVATVAQTAAAVAFGAVATWSALAFS